MNLTEDTDQRTELLAERAKLQSLVADVQAA